VLHLAQQDLLIHFAGNKEVNVRQFILVYSKSIETPMILIKYLPNFHEDIFQLSCVPIIQESQFSFKRRRYIRCHGGSHKVFSDIEKQYHSNNFISRSNITRTISSKVNTKYTSMCTMSILMYASLVTINLFNATKHADSLIILYKCVNYRDCTACKNATYDETMNIKEEIDQDMINQLDTVNTNNGSSIETLTLMFDPSIHLATNHDNALKGYNLQLKQLSKRIKYKQDVINS